MSSQIAKYLGTSSNQLPGDVRITPDGKMVSVIDIIMVVSFTDDNGRLKKSAQKNASDYNKILLRDHPEVSLLQRNFRFSGQGQRDTPVAARKGILQIIQLLRGKRASRFRESIAGLVEQYLDADMGLADDITDRALQAHMADLKAAKESNAESSGEIPRLKSRDSTKELGQVIQQTGAATKYYGLFNGGVNTAVTGMPTKTYRDVQVNLKPREAAREAFTDSMLGMTGTINALVRDNLTEGSNVDEQLEFMQDKCSQAAQLLGLHKKARQVQPREYIAGNKRVMSVDLMARKRQALEQQQPAMIAAS